MAARKNDQLSVTGLGSAIVRNFARHRAVMRKTVARTAPRAEDRQDQPKPRDTRTAEQIRLSATDNREQLAAAVASIRYTIDISARAGDLRDRAAAMLPLYWRGRLKASIVATVIATSGVSAIVAATVVRVKRSR